MALFSRGCDGIEDEVREQYERVAPRYDRRWSYYIASTLSFLKTWADLSPDAMVLDVACGTGEFERLVLAEYPAQRMAGVDISEKMLRIARDKLRDYPHVHFQLAPASALPFPDARFDTIVSASSFHYFDAPEVVLQEMKRVLKPGGELIILDWCKDFLTCRILDRVLRWVDPAHPGCYTRAEFHGLLSDAGFRIDRSDILRFGLFWRLMVATATYH